jgi:hypothetical protein
MFKNKIEAIPFHEFMAGHHSTRKETPRTNNIYAISAFFPAITPESFFPLQDGGFLLFLGGGALIVGSALLERLFAKNGSTMVADIISGLSKVVFPVIVYGTVFWFLFSL